jgi:hypothetical protein
MFGGFGLSKLATHDVRCQLSLSSLTFHQLLIFIYFFRSCPPKKKMILKRTVKLTPRQAAAKQVHSFVRAGNEHLNAHAKSFAILVRYRGNVLLPFGYQALKGAGFVIANMRAIHARLRGTMRDISIFSGLPQIDMDAINAEADVVHAAIRAKMLAKRQRKPAARVNSDVVSHSNNNNQRRAVATYQRIVPVPLPIQVRPHSVTSNNTARTIPPVPVVRGILGRRNRNDYDEIAIDGDEEDGHLPAIVEFNFEVGDFAFVNAPHLTETYKVQITNIDPESGMASYTYCDEQYRRYGQQTCVFAYFTRDEPIRRTRRRSAMLNDYEMNQDDR